MTGGSLRDSVNESVWSPICTSIRRLVWDSVDDSVWSSVVNSVGRSLKILLNPKN